MAEKDKKKRHLQINDTTASEKGTEEAIDLNTTNLLSLHPRLHTSRGKCVGNGIKKKVENGKLLSGVLILLDTLTTCRAVVTL
jgi:hypothetical protein